MIRGRLVKDQDLGRRDGDVPENQSRAVGVGEFDLAQRVREDDAECEDFGNVQEPIVGCRVHRGDRARVDRETVAQGVRSDVVDDDCVRSSWYEQ